MRKITILLFLFFPANLFSGMWDRRDNLLGIIQTQADENTTLRVQNATLLRVLSER